MKISISRTTSMIVIFAVSIIYSVYLGLILNSLVLTTAVIMILPILTLAAIFMKKGFARKVIFTILFVVTIIMLLLATVILMFTGTFSAVGFSFESLGMVALVCCPLALAYIYLAYIQVMEMNNKNNSRRKNLFG